MKIIAGIVGAVIGFVGTLALASLFDFGSNDPIMSGMLALVVFAPMGAFVRGGLGVSLVRPAPDTANDDKPRHDT